MKTIDSKSEKGHEEVPKRRWDDPAAWNAPIIDEIELAIHCPTLLSQEYIEIVYVPEEEEKRYY